MEPTVETVVMIKINQAPDAEPLSHADRAEAAANMLKAGGFNVVGAGYIAKGGQFEGSGMEEWFDKTQPETPTIPYQGGAKLQPDQAGEYLDVLGNDGKVIASFSKEDAKKAFRGIRF